MRTAGRDKECGVRIYYMFLSVHYKYAASFCTIKGLGIIVTIAADYMILPFVQPYAHQKDGKTAFLNDYRIIVEFQNQFTACAKIVIS